MKIKEMQERFIEVLNKIDSKFFNEAINSIKNLETNPIPENGFSDLYIKVCLVNKLTKALLDYNVSSNQKSLFQIDKFCFLDELLYGTPGIRGKSWQELSKLSTNELKNIYKASCKNEKILFNLNVYESKFMEHVDSLYDATTDFLSKFTSLQQFRENFNSDDSFKTKTDLFEINTNIINEGEGLFIPLNAGLRVGASNIGTCVAVCMVGKTYTILKHCSGIIEKLGTDCVEMFNDLIKVNEKKEDIKIYLVGGQARNIADYLPLFYDPQYESFFGNIKDIRLCLDNSSSALVLDTQRNKVGYILDSVTWIDNPAIVSQDLLKTSFHQLVAEDDSNEEKNDGDDNNMKIETTYRI